MNIYVFKLKNLNNLFKNTLRNTREDEVNCRQQTF